MDFKAYRVSRDDGGLQEDVGNLYVKENPNAPHQHIRRIVLGRIKRGLLFLLKDGEHPIGTLWVERGQFADENIIKVKELCIVDPLEKSICVDALEVLITECITSSKQFAFSGVHRYINDKVYKMIDRDVWPTLLEKIGFQKTFFDKGSGHGRIMFNNDVLDN